MPKRSRLPKGNLDTKRHLRMKRARGMIILDKLKGLSPSELKKAWKKLSNDDKQAVVLIGGTFGALTAIMPPLGLSLAIGVLGATGVITALERLFPTQRKVKRR